MAASAGHVTTVDLLLDMGIPVDLQDNSNLNPLSLACQAGKKNIKKYKIINKKWVNKKYKTGKITMLN